MVPCYICAKDSVGGWIAGLPPAPDSQKVGLCPEHNNRANRASAFTAWKELLNREIQFQLDVSRQEDAPLLRLVIQFMDGGKVVIPCFSFGVVNDNMLEVLDENGERKFYPFQHVRSYKVVDRN